MTKHPSPEALETLRVRILADRVARLVRWVCFLAILAGLVLPLAVAAWRANGLVSALAVTGLCVALCWHVKPAGASLSVQAREIDERFKAQE
jgi:hypothetical protein